MGERRKKKFWSYVSGERGRNWVRTFEKTKGGILFIEWYEEVWGQAESVRKRASLGHRDRDEAKKTADELAAAFAKGEEAGTAAHPPGDPTIHGLIDLYLGKETPYKSTGKQGHDRRAGAMFKAFFAKGRRASTLNLGDWTGFIRGRRERRIGPPDTVRKAIRAREKGDPLPPIGDRQIEYDLRFLWAILNWATKTGDHDGNVLLVQNPLRQFVTSRDWPREKNPERPSLLEAQAQAILEASRDIDWRFRVAFVLAHETGHRIGSIRTLRWSDIDKERGWMRWREETDKVDWEHHTPLTAEAIQALGTAEAHRADGKDGWVLPSPSDLERSCSRNIMRDWWNLAQERAGLGDVPRLGWHSLRRKFANDLRHVPLKDLASLGGWKDTQTLLKCYLKEDEQAMVKALQSRRAPQTRRLAGKEEQEGNS